MKEDYIYDVNYLSSFVNYSLDSTKWGDILRYSIEYLLGSNKQKIRTQNLNNILTMFLPIK